MEDGNGDDHSSMTRSLDPEAVFRGDDPASLDEGNDAGAPFDDEYADMTWEQLRGMRTKRIVCLIAVVCIFIGATVGIGVAVSNNNASGTSSDATLVAPPGDLDITCAPANLQTEDGYSACLHACQPSQCCELVDTNPFSCVDDHREACGVYHASCQHLSQKKTQAIATGQVVVDQACSTISLSSEEGVSGCKSICEDYMCCFPGPEDNYPCDVSQAWCADYAACSALSYVDQDGFDSHEEVVETIEQACSEVESVEGHTKCENICRAAQCCFAMLEFPAGDDCSLVKCDHYTPCSVIYGPQEEPGSDSEDDNDDFNIEDLEGGDSVDDATQELYIEIRKQVAEACTLESISEVEGIQNCLNLCQHHLCCFAPGDSENCSPELEDECHLYTECNHLLDNQIQLSPDESLETICSTDTFDEHGPHSCLNTCASHLCCSVDYRLRSSCATDSACGVPYEACSILWPEPVVDEESPNLFPSIQTSCTDGHLASNAGAELCRSFCIQRECCWTPGVGSCVNTVRNGAHLF